MARKINYLGMLNHQHLVKLISYCLEDDHSMLVYEFMSRGSLENHLFRRSSYFQPLSWNLQIKVALGAAKGALGAGKGAWPRSYTSSTAIETKRNAGGGHKKRIHQEQEKHKQLLGFLVPYYIPTEYLNVDIQDKYAFPWSKQVVSSIKGVSSDCEIHSKGCLGEENIIQPPERISSYSLIGCLTLVPLIRFLKVQTFRF
ncbi:unnamed protein product [Lactuca virosa]|uniref:Serine-threonine/tyrosine-protein kinase catalytic domain-containing protein n=1 Tax=Lactuca virosa TaxID=75947 RepID=A0AAU9M2T8_9ASTR|nr:unnamed protein product [Lactuca virosa]